MSGKVQTHSRKDPSGTLLCLLAFGTIPFHAVPRSQLRPPGRVHRLTETYDWPH